MQCPKCAGDLQIVKHATIEAQGCSTCRGLLLKPQVITEVLLYEMVETYLDVGNPRIGKMYDEIDDICCPHCQVDMEKSSDPEQIHIWTEKCPNCGRVFFDAGELTDLKYRTISDFFMDLWKGHRDMV